MSLDVAALWEAEHPGLLRFLRYKLGPDGESAEDLASEIFLRAIANLDTYQVRASTPPRNWLYRIASNLLTDHWRAMQHRRHLGLTDAMSCSIRFEDVDARLDMQAHLDALPERQQRVIVGRFYEGRVQSEYDGMTVEAVKKLTARAFVNLRRRMECAA